MEGGRDGVSEMDGRRVRGCGRGREEEMKKKTIRMLANNKYR